MMSPRETTTREQTLLPTEEVHSNVKMVMVISPRVECNRLRLGTYADTAPFTPCWGDLFWLWYVCFG